MRTGPMGLSLWRRLVRWARAEGPGGHRGRRVRAPRRRPRWLSLEVLEDRALLSAGHGGALHGLRNGHTSDDPSSQTGQTVVVSPPATTETTAPADSGGGG